MSDSLVWRDGELVARPEPGRDVLELVVADRRIGSIRAYASAAGAWQRIHGYGDDERLWSFDVAIDADDDRGRGYGTRSVRNTCEAILARRDATRVVVDVVAANLRAVAAYEKAGFHKVRFLADHDDGDGDRADAWLMEFQPQLPITRTTPTCVHYFKYDGAEHWRIECDLLREDDVGWWLRGYPGSRTTRAGAISSVEQAGFIFLVPHDQWWAGFWNMDRSGPYELYLDIATPAEWTGGEIHLVDLDLDVVRGWDRTVRLLDEDEFEENTARYDYPEHVQRNARDAATRLVRRVQDAEPPFDLFGVTPSTVI